MTLGFIDRTYLGDATIAMAVAVSLRLKASAP